MLIVFGAALRRRPRRGVRAPPGPLRRSRCRSPSPALVGGVRRRRPASGQHQGAPRPPGAVAVDGPALFLQGTILVLATLGGAAHRRAASTATRATRSSRRRPPCRARADETATGRGRRGADRGLPADRCSPSAACCSSRPPNDLLILFVALEVLSLPLYLLCGLARRRRLLSQEAALKYFLLGRLLLGVLPLRLALLYGYAGIARPRATSHGATVAATANDTLLLIGLALLVVGLLFKVGAVPFHTWTPDVYQGAPTPVTGFMAACTKVAAFGALLRVFYVALRRRCAGTGGRSSGRWPSSRWSSARSSRITQTDVKRMLAYSSIAHAGFILVGVIGARPRPAWPARCSTCVAYGFTTIGAFAVVTLVRDAGGRGHPPVAVGRAGRRSPVLAGGVRALPARVRRHPADRGLHREVRRVLGRRSSGGATPLVVVGVARQRDRRVLLRPRHRADVLLRPGRRRAHAWSVPERVHHGRPSAIGVAVTLVLGVLPAAVARPGRAARRVVPP